MIDTGVRAVLRASFLLLLFCGSAGCDPCCTRPKAPDTIVDDNIPTSPPLPGPAGETSMTLRGRGYAVTRFAPPTHAEMTGPQCGELINLANYHQDVLCVARSEAHFDNCAFEESIGYVNQLIADARRLASAGKQKGALYTLGRAIHAMQDFYAHSNYVELMALVHPSSFLEVAPVRLWTARGQALVLDMRNGKLAGAPLPQGARLESGTSPCTPRRCPSGTPSHGEMAKDGPTKGRGDHPTPEGWVPRTLYHAAYELGRSETESFLEDVLLNWPEFRGLCGPAIPYQVRMDSVSE